jgi:hypothetical protein
MRTTLWAGLLALAMVAGCLGSPDPAGISDATLNEHGWSQTDQTEQSVAMGLGQISTRDYRGPGNQDTTGATVATATDVPILDERRFVPQAIERVEEQRGIDFKEAGSTTVSLPELGVDNAEANLYEFQKDGANGKAILITPDQCDGFVISVGFGVTGAGGFSASDATYEEAKDVARNVVC